MKRNSFYLLTLLIIWSCGSNSGDAVAEKPEQTASELFKTHCAICHGSDGRKGFAGAKLLPESILTIDERIAIITKGKGAMMAYESVMTSAQIKAVAEYTTTLK